MGSMIPSMKWNIKIIETTNRYICIYIYTYLLSINICISSYVYTDMPIYILIYRYSNMFNIFNGNFRP